jgi:hypothetical protein
MKKVVKTPFDLIIGKKKNNMYPDKFGKPIAKNLGGSGKVGMNAVNMILGNSRNKLYPKGIHKKDTKKMGKVKVTPMSFFDKIIKGK